MSTNCVKCIKRPRVPPSLYCTACDSEQWMETCQKMIDKYEPLATYFQTWGKHCGAPEDVFVGQTCKMLAEIVGDIAKGLKRVEEGPYIDTSMVLMQAISPKVDEHLLMALRFLYYCRAYSAIPDHMYDQAEKEYLNRDDVDDSPLMNPGSDNPEDYPRIVQTLALYVLFVTDERRKLGATSI